jgi:hypothetical protein
MHQELFHLVNKHITPIRFIDAANALGHSGFLNEPPLCKLMLLQMVRTYKTCYPGSLKIEKSFCVPDGDQRWPRWSHGCELGLILDGLRGRAFQSVIPVGEMQEYHMLCRMLSPYSQKAAPSSQPHRAITPPTLPSPNTIPRVTFEDIKAALVVFKSIYGHTHMTRKFKVDLNDQRYPTAIRGRSFGEIINKIVEGRSYKDRCDELFAADLLTPKSKAQNKRKHEEYDKSTEIRPPQPRQRKRSFIAESFGLTVKGKKHSPPLKFPIVKKCLLVFRSIYSHLQVPLQFIIPSDDIRYPPGIRGRDFGALVRNIRYGITHRKHQQELLAIGLEFAKSGNLHRVETAIESIYDVSLSSVEEEKDDVDQGEEEVDEVEEEEDGISEEGDELIDLFTTKREFSIAS